MCKIRSTGQNKHHSRALPLKVTLNITLILFISPKHQILSPAMQFLLYFFIALQTAPIPDGIRIFGLHLSAVQVCGRHVHDQFPPFLRFHFVVMIQIYNVYKHLHLFVQNVDISAAKRLADFMSGKATVAIPVEFLRVLKIRKEEYDENDDWL
jgi:hypothetical protein